jgi:hypothetical protein
MKSGRGRVVRRVPEVNVGRVLAPLALDTRSVYSDWAACIKLRRNSNWGKNMGKKAENGCRQKTPQT